MQIKIKINVALLSFFLISSYAVADNDIWSITGNTLKKHIVDSENSSLTTSTITSTLNATYTVANWFLSSPKTQRIWTTYTEGGNAGALAINNVSGTQMNHQFTASHSILGLKKGANEKLFFTLKEGSNFKLKVYDLMSASVDDTFSTYTTTGSHTFNNYATNVFYAAKNDRLYQRSDSEAWVVLNASTGALDSTFTPSSPLYESIAYDEKSHRMYALIDSAVSATNTTGAWSGKKRPRLSYIDLDDNSQTNVGTSIGQYVVTSTNTFASISPTKNLFWVSNAFFDTDGGAVGTQRTLGISLTTGAVIHDLLHSATGFIIPTSDPIFYTNTSFSLTNSFSGNALIHKAGSGTLTYTGVNNSSGGVSIAGGTLSIPGSSQLGSGTLTLEGGALKLTGAATISNAISADGASTFNTSTNAVTLSGTISGSSAITKTGAGVLTLTGALSNTGGFNVSAGELKVNNSSGSAPATLNGGTLSGTGTLGNLIANSGTINPGNSIGTLNVSGNVTLGSSNVLVIEVDAAGNSDKIVATGSVAAGGTLRISPETSETYDGVTYTIITGSSISGSFATTEITTCSGTTPSVSYGSTSITVTLSGCTSSQSKNYSAVSSYFNDLTSSGDMATIKTEINGLSGDTYTSALKALDYNTVGAINKVSLKHSDFAKNIIGQRVAISNSNHSSTMNKISYIDQSNDKSLLNFKEIFSGLKGANGWWSKFYGGTTNRDTDKFIGNNGYDDDYYGMVFGLDGKQDNAITGITLSVQEGNIQSDGLEGDTDYTSFNLSPYYASQNKDGSGYVIQTNLQVIDVSSKRYLKFGSINRTAKGDYTNYSIGANLDYSLKTLNFSDLKIDSKINISYQFNHQESFKEKGANSLNIHVKKSSYQLASIGFSELITAHKAKGFKPFVSLSGSYNSYLSDTDSKQSFQNQASTYKTKIDKNNWMSGSIKTGFIKQSENKESFLVLGYTRSYKETDLYLQLGININF